ncbi:C39 family peptidase [Dactylosporangium sp. NPDC048998]|uniref:C39 family peptidase n=1 Tax=Dactylosporangium sp. NPDC048998 TaxID=3363976 RepID=UPI0037132F13
MRHRSIRPLLNRATSHRLYPAMLGSAAAIVAAVTTGVLFNQTEAPAGAHDTAVVAMGAADGNNRPVLDAAPASPAPVSAAPEAPAEKVLQYDFQFQPNYYYCGPASTRIALTSDGVTLSQDEIARQLGTTTSGTNSAAETTRVLNNALGKDVYQTRWIPGQKATPEEAARVQDDVVRAISGDRAIVANIVGGATDAVGVYHEFSGGHFISIVGYRDNGRAVQVADPSGMFGPRTYWMATSNMANWIAARGYSA